MEQGNVKLNQFRQYLKEQEKSGNTIEKYVRDIRNFLNFAGGRTLERELVLQYKEYLRQNYQISSVNSMLAALNCYLSHIGKEEYRVRNCRQQRRIFREEEKELDRKEYQRLLWEARRRGKYRLCSIMQTIASTGIRIGELQYITVETLEKRRVRIDCKGKIRIILLPKSLTVILKDYCRKQRIKRGCVFVTKHGNPIDRRNIWAEMKEICLAARVPKSKVFPHNLRHLFAKCFYEREKDLARLADYLGHSSVETTRRYTMISSAEACERQLDLGLLMIEKEA